MHDLADNLMSGNEVRFQRREFILRDMEICPAYPAGKDAQQDVARLRLRQIDLLHLKKRICRFAVDL
jgi:hypothetical protein